ncbi:YciI family protein [Agromyces sp. SYSU K20354]|uniref:YciI family protein n=1 Tax=Agromyces cavernae TaxID=2898659 RepID=UPI001E5C85F4|nr:YciI family protein [Agromyces cavernae]MCD2443801.1 YciI family protein [Agromyces cavernae]
MAKYLVLYHADVSAEQQMQQSEADGQAEMQAWMDWAGAAGDAVVDLGTPLGEVRMVTSGGASTSSTTVAGYSIVEAADADAAAAIMTGHPHLKIGTIAIHEMAAIPGM